MTGHQFEFYYAGLLECLGWTRIQVIGGKSGGDGGADILATDPRNRDFAIQCKRYAPCSTSGIRPQGLTWLVTRRAGTR
jgi:restriction system protein